MTFKTMTRLCFAMLAAATVVFGVAASAQAQDYSRSYRYGGGIHIPGAPDAGGGAVRRDIVNVNSGIDVGGVLGCSGIDLKGMIKNTFEVGDLAGEFKDYLKNTLATEALSLLYSQPGVSQVLDGMKAIGHARASILQERCNANEILADVTNQRLKSEAQALCLKENDNSVADCEGGALGEYVERIAASKRWSGTLHDHLCSEENSTACDFIPNFTYDVGAGTGQDIPPPYSSDDIIDEARDAAMNCFQERGQRVAMLVNEQGYAGAQAMIGSGQAKIYCNGEDPASMSQNNGTGGSNGSGEPGNQDDTQDPVARHLAGLSPAESCVLEEAADEEGESPIQIDVENLTTAVDQAENMNIMEIVKAHIECIIGKEIHGHVDLNITTGPAVEALAAWNGLSEVYALKAFLNLNAMRIRKLSQAIINSGGRESTKSCERDDEGVKVNPECKDSMSPPLLDKATALLQQFRDEQDAAMADLEMAENVADRVERMNRQREENKNQAAGGVARAGQRGGSVSRNAERVFYPDYFR